MNLNIQENTRIKITGFIIAIRNVHSVNITYVFNKILLFNFIIIYFKLFFSVHYLMVIHKVMTRNMEI